MSAHPYIPNSAPVVRAKMFEALGISSTDDLLESIPQRLRLAGNPDLPPALTSESELRRYFRDALAANIDTVGYVSFLGGGCWRHTVPAVCDEIAGRGEFTSGFMGMGGASTTGAYQGLFEYQSLIAELVGLDLSSLPVYDWPWAASIGLLMAVRETGRSTLLVADTIGPDRRRQIQARLPLRVTIQSVGHDPRTGGVDLADLTAKSDDAAAFYFENPSYLGLFEEHLDDVRAVTAAAGCRLIAGVDPTSLGVAREPGSYGADIACGELQPLGLHQTYGGSAAGFLACRLDGPLAAQLPNIYIAAVPTVRSGEYDFFWGNFESTSYATRGESDDVIGCGSTLSGIVAATYLALMGPQGMVDLGNGLLARAAYLREALSAIPGISTSRLTGNPFKELVVDFSGTGLSPADINTALLEKKIFGGIDLSADFADLQGCALYCVSEEHTREDLDHLTDALKEVLQ